MENRPLKFLVTGRTGAGKSSLINAFLNKKICKVGLGGPVTQDITTYPYQEPNSKETLFIVDVPGFGEAAMHEKRIADIDNLMPEIDAIILVVGAPDRAWEYEKDFIKHIKDSTKNMPIIVVANKIDLIPPVREWNPETFSPEYPYTNEKEENADSWLRSLTVACGLTRKDVVPVSSGEAFSEKKFGIDHLRVAIRNSMPQARQAKLDMVLEMKDTQDVKANAIIWAAAVAAGAASCIPVPLADAAIIFPAQIVMIISIAGVYNCVLTKETAGNLLLPIATTFAGRYAAGELAKIIPVWGEVVAAGIAATFTLAIGYTFKAFFAEGLYNPTPEEIKARFEENSKKAKEEKKKLMEEAKKKAKKE